MAKTTGFAALTAAEEKVSTDTAEETTETGSEETTASPAPATPTFDEEPSSEASAATDTRVLNDLPVSEWTTAELESYIAGTVSEETYQATIKEAISEHLRRESKLSAAWTIAETRKFLLTDELPAKTSKGAWVNDVTRQYRSAQEWETNELESWALGEIKPEGATHAGGLAAELKSRLNLNVPTSDPDTVIANYLHATGQASAATVETRPTPATVEVSESKKAEVESAANLEGLTDMNQSYLEASLKRFDETMKVGRSITPEVSGAAQKLLREVMVYSIGLPDPVGAKSAMTYLLSYFKARRADGQLFEDTYAYRGIPDMRSTEKEKLAHRDLLTLFLVYADDMVELRAQTDIPTLIAGVDPKFQSRVLEFFSKQ